MRREQEVTVHIEEEQTIIELSDRMQQYQAEVYVTKMYRGMMHEINLKSLLGLITIHLGNGDTISIRAEGSDAEEALHAVVDYLT